MARATLPTLSDRTAGVLLHPTSLPGGGDLGAAAHAFVDLGASRRAALVADAAGRPDRLRQFALQRAVGVRGEPGAGRRSTGCSTTACWPAADRRARPARRAVLRDRASPRRRGARSPRASTPSRGARGPGSTTSRSTRAIKRAHGDGPVDALAGAAARSRRRRRWRGARDVHADEIRFARFVPVALRRATGRRCAATRHARGVALIGDMPIFVAHDSADVWAHPRALPPRRRGRADARRRRAARLLQRRPASAGATRSTAGREMRATGYAWWIDALRARRWRASTPSASTTSSASTRYWEIPAREPTADERPLAAGARARASSTRVGAALGELPLIAEDLGRGHAGGRGAARRVRAAGHQAPAVRVRHRSAGARASCRTTTRARAVVYTGTHDNDTTVGLVPRPGQRHAQRRADGARAARGAALPGRADGRRGDEIHWDMIRAIMASVANLAIVPVQDLLGLGSEARMNRPGTADRQLGVAPARRRADARASPTALARPDRDLRRGDRKREPTT